MDTIELTKAIKDILGEIGIVIMELSGGTKECCLTAAHELYSLLTEYAPDEDCTDVLEQFLYTTGVDLSDI